MDNNKPNKYYIGSQRKIVKSFIYKSLKEVIGDFSDKVFVDAFGGFGYVGSFFKDKVKKVIASDIDGNFVPFLKYYIENLLPVVEEDILIEEIMVNSGLKNGFLSQNFVNRGYLTIENANKIDAIREYIFKLKSERRIKRHQFWFLYASLIESALNVMDKEIPFKLYPSISNISFNEHKAYNISCNKLLGRIKDYDILYLNPPQRKDDINNRQFHLIKAITDYKCFEPQGEQGYNINNFKSSWLISPRESLRQLDKIINKTTAKYVILSHNNKGEIFKEKHLQKINNIMSKYGEYRFFVYNHKMYRYKKRNVTEYLHVLIKP